MTAFVIILLVLAALSTLFVLGMGLKGLLLGNTTPQRSQQLMQKRVLFQAIAIALAVVLLLIAGASGR